MADQPDDTIEGALGRLEADLRLQAAGLARAELDADVAERTRAAWGEVSLADRLRAAALDGARPAELVLEVRGAGLLVGAVTDVGADHLALLAPGRTTWWVALSAVLAVEGLPHAGGPPPSQVAARWSLRAVLRRLSRDRVPVVLVRCDGTTAEGTIDVVGADHLDLAVHPRDVPRRRAAVLRTLSVPVAQVAAVSAEVS